MILYGLKNCDTCKKALKALEADGREVNFVDIRQDADLATQVPAWLEQVGKDRLINTRSTTWRQLDEDERAKADHPVDVIQLLKDNPTLIKRPVIEVEGEVHVGWKKDVQEALGL